MAHYLFGKEVAGPPTASTPSSKTPSKKKTSPLSSWFGSPEHGGAPNFGSPEDVQPKEKQSSIDTTSAQQNTTNKGNIQTSLVSALGEEVESNDEFSQLLLDALQNGTLPSSSLSSPSSSVVPSSPSSLSS